jgi:peroxiredoxin Q/BCP
MARRPRGGWFTAALLALLLPAAAGAQAAGAAAAPPAPPAIAVGQTAPDFSLPGATRYGSLAAPVKLSDFRGQTVVIAFFYKARTKG